MNPSPESGEDAPAVARRQCTERREVPDRRETPTSPWDTLRGVGRRLYCRRAAERRQPHFVDRFPAVTLALVLVLVTASLVDAVLTFYLLEAGANELNPLIDRLLDFGPLAYLLGKYVLTVVGLPVLLVFGAFYLFGTRLRVSHLIPLLIIAYLCLIGYQIALVVQLDAL